MQWDMAKMICYSKIQLCVMSCNCIFWHVEYFYHHKNYMVSYYTLCSIFYNWFYRKKLLVFTCYDQNVKKLVATGLDQSFGSLFWFGRVLEQLPTATGCWFVQIRLKNWTRLDLWTLGEIEELEGGDVTLLMEVPAEEAVGRRDNMAEINASGILAAGVLRGEPTSQSSSPLSSTLTSMSAWVADKHDKLPGSEAYIPQGWVPCMNACILQ